MKILNLLCDDNFSHIFSMVPFSTHARHVQCVCKRFFNVSNAWVLHSLRSTNKKCINEIFINTFCVAQKSYDLSKRTFDLFMMGGLVCTKHIDCFQRLRYDYSLHFIDMLCNIYNVYGEFNHNTVKVKTNEYKKLLSDWFEKKKGWGGSMHTPVDIGKGSIMSTVAIQWLEGKVDKEPFFSPLVTGLSLPLLMIAVLNLDDENVTTFKYVLENSNPNFLITYFKQEHLVHQSCITALSLAIMKHDNNKIIQLLLEHGSSPNIKSAYMFKNGKEGKWDILMMTIAFGGNSVKNRVSMLLNHGADPAYVSESNESALLFAMIKHTHALENKDTEEENTYLEIITMIMQASKRKHLQKIFTEPSTFQHNYKQFVSFQCLPNKLGTSSMSECILEKNGSFAPIVMKQGILNLKRVKCQETEECCICLDEINEFVCPWVCMHKFHKDCTQTLAFCPLCRNEQFNVQMEPSKKQKFAYHYEFGWVA